MWAACAALRARDARWNNPFFDPRFLQLVASVRPDTQLAIAEEGSDLVAWCGLHRRRDGWARPAGAPFCDWHGPVTAPNAALTAQAMLEGLGLAGLTALGHAPPWSGSRWGDTREGAHLSVLGEGWEAFLENQRALFPRHFKKMRRVRRNAEREHGPLRTVFDDRSQVAFERLLALKREQFARTGRHDVLAPAWAKALMQAAFEASAPGFRGRLSTLYLGDTPAAMEFSLQSDSVLHGWIVAFDPDFHSLSPGYLLVHDMLAAMPDAGLGTYDAGIGLDYYKKYYCNVMRPLDHGRVGSGRVALAPTRLAGTGWRLAERSLPRPAALLMARVRRRSDQILVSETGLAGRARGFLGTLSRPPG